MPRFEDAFRAAIESSLDPDALAQLKQAARTVAETPPTIIAAIWVATTLGPQHAAAVRAVSTHLADRYRLEVQFDVERCCQVRFSQRLVECKPLAFLPKAVSIETILRVVLGATASKAATG